MAFVPGLSKKQVQKVITDYANIAPATMQLIDDLSAQINDPNDPAAALIGRMVVAESDINNVESSVSNLNSAVSGKQDIVSGISSSEIQTLDGIQSNIQNQLNSKASTSSPTLSNPTLTGTVTLPDGSIANSKLQNSSISINGSSIPLGGSATVVGQALPSQSGNSGKALVTDGSNLEWGLIDVSNLTNPVVSIGNYTPSRGVITMVPTTQNGAGTENYLSLTVNALTRQGYFTLTPPPYNGMNESRYRYVEQLGSTATNEANTSYYPERVYKIKVPKAWLLGQVGISNVPGWAGWKEDEYAIVNYTNTQSGWDPGYTQYTYTINFTVPDGIDLVTQQSNRSLYGQFGFYRYYGDVKVLEELKYLDGVTSNIQSQITSGELLDRTLKVSNETVQLGTSRTFDGKITINFVPDLDPESTGGFAKVAILNDPFDEDLYNWFRNTALLTSTDNGWNQNFSSGEYYTRVTGTSIGDFEFKTFGWGSMSYNQLEISIDWKGALDYRTGLSGTISLVKKAKTEISPSEIKHLDGLSVNVQDTFDSLTITPKIVKPTLADPAFEFNNDLIFASGETDVGHSGYITAYPWENFYHISFWYPYIQTLCNNAYTLIGAAVANGDTSYRLKIEYNTYNSATATYIPAETTLSIIGFTSQAGGNYEMLTQDSRSLASHNYISYDYITKLSVVQLADPITLTYTEFKDVALGNLTDPTISILEPTAVELLNENIHPQGMGGITYTTNNDGTATIEVAISTVYSQPIYTALNGRDLVNEYVTISFPGVPNLVGPNRIIGSTFGPTQPTPVLTIEYSGDSASNEYVSNPLTVIAIVENLPSVTISSTELKALDGITGNIQAQLDYIMSLINP